MGIDVNRVTAIRVINPYPSTVGPAPIRTNIERPTGVEIDRKRAALPTCDGINDSPSHIVEKTLDEGDRLCRILFGVPDVLLVGIAREAQHTVGDRPPRTPRRPKEFRRYSRLIALNINARNVYISGHREGVVRPSCSRRPMTVMRITRLERSPDLFRTGICRHDDRHIPCDFGAIVR